MNKDTCAHHDLRTNSQVAGQDGLALSAGCRPARQQGALTMGSTFYDDVYGMIDKHRATKDGGEFGAKNDDGMRVAQMEKVMHFNC